MVRDRISTALDKSFVSNDLSTAPRKSVRQPTKAFRAAASARIQCGSGKNFAVVSTASAVTDEMPRRLSQAGLDRTEGGELVVLPVEIRRNDARVTQF
jgi:hypothetical protein